MAEPGTNIITLTDSYKQTHWAMYPPGTRYVGSYLEARSGGEYPETVFFGLQYLLERYIAGSVVSLDKIEAAAELCRKHFGQELFNREGWEYILRQHFGRLPVRIRAVDEGTVVPESNALLTIENTDPRCAWVVNHLETLLVQLWYPCTVATISRAQKILLSNGLELSGTPDKLPFMLHDFGYRGSSSVESAAVGGAAHLVNFLGTDNIAAMEMLMQHYSAEMPGFSVPAAEHSTITSWGQGGEADAYRHILETFKSGIVSVVSDSWDIRRACDELWGAELKAEVQGAPGRVLVVRPDSGEPAQIVPECLNILGERFGSDKNSKGFKVLPDYVRLIQGDGISRESLPVIVSAVLSAGWSLDNLVFGSGGGLLQACDRDTQRFALKCSWVNVSGEERDVYKAPASDMSKASKRGKLKLIKTDDGYETRNIADPRQDQLHEVFRNGHILRRTSLDDVRGLDRIPSGG